MDFSRHHTINRAAIAARVTTAIRATTQLVARAPSGDASGRVVTRMVAG